MKWVDCEAFNQGTCRAFSHNPFRLPRLAKAPALLAEAPRCEYDQWVQDQRIKVPEHFRQIRESLADVIPEEAADLERRREAADVTEEVGGPTSL